MEGRFFLIPRAAGNPEFAHVFSGCKPQNPCDYYRLMKTLLTITVTALALASFATSTFAGSCGSCPGEGGEKSKDKSKTEESTQS